MMNPVEVLANSLARLVFKNEKGDEATMRLSFASDGTPSLTVVTTSANGKSREKVHAPKKFDPRLANWTTANLADEAATALLKAGFVGVASGPGTPDFVILTDVGPPMSEAFAIDERRGVAWLGDWGWLRRVDLATGKVESTSLGEYPAVHELVVDDEGAPWILADYDVSTPSGGFRTPAEAEVRFAVLRFDGRAFETKTVVAVAREAFGRVAKCLAIANDGTALVPHADGAAHVRLDGTPIRTYRLGTMKHWGPRVAMSPDGRWIATTVSPGAIDVHEGESDTTRRRLEMDDVISMVVHDDGTVDVGAGTPNWDFQRVPLSGEIVKIGARAARYATGPDMSSVYSSNDATLTMWSVAGEAVRKLPILGGNRGSRIVATTAAIYVRTSAGVFQRLSGLS